METPVAEPPPFAPDKIRGLKYEPNHVAGIMEDKLGTKFKNPPKKAKVTVPNMIVIQLQRRTDEDLLRMFSRDHDDPTGFYHIDSNTYFYWGNSISDQLHLDNYFIELHENAHAYVAQESRNLPITNLESLILQLTLHEGIADWMATEVLARLDPATPENQTQLYHFGMINSEKPGVKDTKINEHGINTALASVYDFLAESRRQQQPASVANFIKVKSELDKVYKLGHYYVFHHVQRLRSQGLSISDSLRLIIKNPPARIEQLLASKYIPMTTKAR